MNRIGAIGALEKRGQPKGGMIGIRIHGDFPMLIRIISDF